MVVASPEQVSSDVGSEAVILHLSREIYYGLNPVGAFVWNLIQTPTSVGELRRAVLAAYKVAPDQCRHDLDELLHALREEGLIEVRDGAAS